jgi:four helix bundle protein
VKTKNIIVDKSFNFSLLLIQFYKELIASREYVLSKQLLRSGTSVRANVEEAMAGQTRKDFIAKMSTASKEARETKYWQFVKYDYSILLSEIDQIINILTAIVKTTQLTTKQHP